jgi:hypothetical protein
MLWANGDLTPEQIQQLMDALAGDPAASGQAIGASSGCGAESDWNVTGEEIFATKEWSLTNTIDPSLSETGSLTLRHTPD